MKPIFTPVALVAIAATFVATPFLPPPAAAHEGIVHEGCAAGQSFAAGDITVTGAFSRAMLPNAPTGGAYMSITNAGSADDRLVGVTTEAASAELHEMSIVDGMMKMASLPDGIPVPAGETVTLAPGGLHVMLMDVRTPFKEGECLALTLQFEAAGSLPVVVSVGPVGASAAPEGHAHH